MPNNEGFVMPYEEAFTQLATIPHQLGLADYSIELYTCNSCAAVVDYWGREKHYDWHQMNERLIASSQCSNGPFV